MKCGSGSGANIVTTNIGVPVLYKPPIISVKEARKLLGPAAANLTNGEVRSMIADWEQIARLTIRDYLVRKSGMLK